MLWTWLLLHLLRNPKVFAKQFTNDFVVEMAVDAKRANQIAQMAGMINLGPIFEQHWHFVSPRLKKRDTSSRASKENTALYSIPEVKWFKQQRILRRVKRDYSTIPKSRRASTFADDILNYRFRRKALSGEFSGPGSHYGADDPLFKSMWYLNPDILHRKRTTSNADTAGTMRHMNVVKAWEMGYTGKGIVVTILDDGIEKDHPDLKANYDPDASYDINDNDIDPQPRYNPSNENRHGTRCAGEVAATADNGICVPGVAYNAKIGGIRMLDGDVTDMVEARSIKHASDHVDIYSVSWGPEDDGKTVDGPAEMAKKAFKEGITTGRQGKGSIYVWASGNGGRYNDNCNCDGYTNLMYTISISSTSEQENIPWYSEPCASTLASTYSSGSQSENQIITTDIRKTCTEHHTGTSASAPIAAGIVALTLEANGNLGWRDVQHIIIRTSKRQLLVAQDWSVNGVKRWFSHRYGYGLMDAGAMVEMAETWQNVPPQRECGKEVVKRATRHSTKNRIEPGNTASNPFTLEFLFRAVDCHHSAKVDKMEHVIAKISLSFPRRGALEIYLISPMGTKSMILGRRQHDSSPKGFSNFNFLTVHFWDEKPFGKWTLQIVNTGNPNNGAKGTLKRFELFIHGTGEDQYKENQPVRSNPGHFKRIAVLRSSNSSFPLNQTKSNDPNGKTVPTLANDLSTTPPLLEKSPSSALTLKHKFIFVYMFVMKFIIH